MANCFDIVRKFIVDKGYTFTPAELLKLENTFLKQETILKEKGGSFFDTITDPLDPQTSVSNPLDP